VTARTGVTLVELLVVLAILAVTSALASVAFRSAETDRDRTLARTVDRVREKFGARSIMPASLLD